MSSYYFSNQFKPSVGLVRLSPFYFQPYLLAPNIMISMHSFWEYAVKLEANNNVMVIGCTS